MERCINLIKTIYFYKSRIKCMTTNNPLKPYLYEAIIYLDINNKPKYKKMKLNL